jgi:hypothetical protein
VRASNGRGAEPLVGLFPKPFDEPFDIAVRGGICGSGRAPTGPTCAPIGAPLPAMSFGPRKSLTRVSTSWLIEMLLVSQKAFNRS